MTDTTVKNLDVEQAGKSYVYIIALIVSMGGFLFGYGLNVTGSAMIFMKDIFSLDAAQIGFAMGSAILGCIIGSFIGGGLSDKWGRKSSLLIATILFAVGSLGTALPQNIFQFNLFRILGGIGIGLASVVSPMYIAEIAPARIRGRLVLMYQLAIGIGALAAVLVAYFLSFTEAWRLIFASGLVPSVLLLMFLYYVPRSPRWLMEKNRSDEAEGVLIKINGRQQAELEIQQINDSLTQEQGTFGELFQPGIRRALVVTIFLALMANLTGFSCVAYYMPLLFQKAGFEQADKAILLTVFIYGCNIFLTLLTVWLVDRVGRRPLWLVASLAMACASGLMGYVFFGGVTGLFVVFAVLMMLWPHAIGLGALPWLMISELFPTRIRARGVGIATIVVWVGGYTATQFFPMVNGFFEKHFNSPAGTFWIFSGICIFSFIFSWSQLPETKGKTLEDIAESWKKK